MIRQPKTILVVNPNTTQAVTQAFVAAIGSIAPPELTFKGVTGSFGARIVTVAAENTVAAFGTLELIAKHVVDCDAVILAISFDSGLDAARSILPIPCVGISHAALFAAAQGDRRVGVIFFGEKSRTLYEELVRSCGIAPVGCIAVEISSVADYLTPHSKDGAVLQAVENLVARGAEAIAIFGAAIVGMAARLQPQSNVPLFDGLAALNETLRQIDANSNHDTALQLPVGPSENLSPELTRLMTGTLFETPPGRR